MAAASQLILTPELYQYLLTISLKEPEILKALRIETAKLPAGNMQIAPEQGQFLRLLIELVGAKKTLDIGVLTGYSSLVVALALPTDGKVVACDNDIRATSIAQQFWKRAGVENKIDLHIAPALETLSSLLTMGAAGTFDFAFIDADKANYIHYYEKCLQLIRQGGLIAIDNTLWYGRVADLQNQDNTTLAMRAFNQHVFQDKRVTLSVIPIGDGLTLVRKKYG